MKDQAAHIKTIVIEIQWVLIAQWILVLSNFNQIIQRKQITQKKEKHKRFMECMLTPVINGIMEAAWELTEIWRRSMIPQLIIRVSFISIRKVKDNNIINNKVIDNHNKEAEV